MNEFNPNQMRLVGVVQSALNPAERLTLVGNQWALARACKADINPVRVVKALQTGVVD